MNDQIKDTEIPRPFLFDDTPPPDGQYWVFQMNDCDWYLATSLHEAVQQYQSESNCDDEEIADARPLSQLEMDELIFRDEGVDSDTYEPIERSFRLQLARMIEEGDTKPGLFASTES